MIGNANEFIVFSTVTERCDLLSFFFFLAVCSVFVRSSFYRDNHIASCKKTKDQKTKNIYLLVPHFLSNQIVPEIDFFFFFVHLLAESTSLSIDKTWKPLFPLVGALSSPMTSLSWHLPLTLKVSSFLTLARTVTPYLKFNWWKNVKPSGSALEKKSDRIEDWELALSPQ